MTQTNSQGYGIRMIEVGSAFLIENNIFEGLMISDAMEGGWGGNVISYNFSTLPRFPQISERAAFGGACALLFMKLV